MKPLTRHQTAWRAAQDLEEGTYVNLGLGMPTLVANYKPKDRDFMFHSENGIVGVGPLASEDKADADFVDAGSQKITLLPGASLSDSAMAFAMIRGGHVDVTLLGGFEVSATGDLANWDAKMSHKGQLVGGAMDLVAGAKSVRVVMQHTTKDGSPRLVETCSYPLTGVGVVDRDGIIDGSTISEGHALVGIASSGCEPPVPTQVLVIFEADATVAAAARSIAPVPQPKSSAFPGAACRSMSPGRSRNAR